MQRFCVQANTHGIARSASSSVGRRRPRPRRRPRADLEQRQLVDRREGAEEARRTPGRPRRARGTGAGDVCETASIVSRAPLGASGRTRSGNAVSSVAASAASRFRRRDPGRPYLKAIVSPCSVSLSRPSTACGGCARIAAYVGPPPRPALPPRPWKIVSSTPRSRREPRELLLRAVDLPLRGQEAAVLAGVGVADHHLEPLARAAGRGAPRTSDAGTAQVVDRLEQRHDRRRSSPASRGERLGERARRPPSASSRRSAGRSHAGPRRAGAPPPREHRRGARRDRRAAVGVEAKVELRDVEPETSSRRAQRGEPAVRDARAAGGRAGSARRRRARRAARRPSGSRRRRAAPRSRSAGGGTARSGCGPAGRSTAADAGVGVDERRSTSPHDAASARTSRAKQVPDRSADRARRPRAPSPAPAFGLPSRSPPIQLPKRSGDAGPSRSRQPRRGPGAASQRLCSRNQSALADLVDDARPLRAHLVGLPEERDLLAEAPLDARSRSPGVSRGSSSAASELRRARGASRGSSAAAPRSGAP